MFLIFPVIQFVFEKSEFESLLRLALNMIVSVWYNDSKAK